uniref:AlNc14C4G575 protein n=1 Tax=Albugo laibachii Nc14 TaxID=890382 RepID=F0W0D2_9STRA|nr:AlNc14C4G575 [Albugo laibachii Nc14]|eukprot:CCA14504.1 AlNc14C4G575 [Albugo laibachii Nc14]
MVTKPSFTKFFIMQIHRRMRIITNININLDASVYSCQSCLLGNVGALRANLALEKKIILNLDVRNFEKRVQILRL